MSKPTKKELHQLNQHQSGWGDDEQFHSEFDNLLEDKLRRLDPEWMEKMSKIYRESGMGRWYA